MSGETRLKPEWVIERQGKKMVLYQGLLHLAHEDGLVNISTTVVQCPSDLNGQTCIVHATVQTAKGTFSGIGDTTPKNVGKMVADHAIRMAETRAKARALRDALDIAYVAAEELGDDAPAAAPQRGEWPQNGQGVRRPAQTPPTAAVARPSGPPDVSTLRQRYDQLRGLALTVGLDDVPPAPEGATVNELTDLGIALRERVDEARAAKRVQP